MAGELERIMEIEADLDRKISRLKGNAGNFGISAKEFNQEMRNFIMHPDDSEEKQKLLDELVKRQLAEKWKEEYEQKSNDPWKHRSKGLRCDTCVWFVVKQTEHTAPNVGRCRKHAPTLNGFPAVFREDWCGDHKLDENKL